MENFQYSVQLSDQDWAEFSAATEECALLQAGLASGDELLSSDIDQGDSSGSSPPGPPPLLGGSGWRGLKEEDQGVPQQLVSRSWQEPVLAPGAGQQMPGTSARSEARPSLSSGASPPGQGTALQAPVSSGAEMQRLLQGPVPRDPPPKPPGEPPPSPEPPGHSTAPQRPPGSPRTSPGSPGASPRSPSRKKRRAAGAKGGGRSGAAGPASAPLGSPLPTEARPEGDPGPAGTMGKGPAAGMQEQTAGAQQDTLGPESTAAAEREARPPPGLDPPPAPLTAQGPGPLRTTPRADPHPVPTPATQRPGPDFSAAESDRAPSETASELHPDTPVSVPACEPRLDVHRPPPGPEVTPEVDSSAPVRKPPPQPLMDEPAPAPQTRPDLKEAGAAPPAKLCLSPVGSSGKEFPGEPSADAPGHAWEQPSPGPVPAAKKKKVRFSVAVPSPEEPGPGEASRPLSPASAWSPAPRTAAGGRGGPGAWDAVAVGPRPPQARILKHLPPPAPSASEGLGYRSCFAVTVPEAYEFFFCDTIEEEDEDAEEAAEAGKAPGQAQWPEVCEFFFRDSRAQRSRHRRPRQPPAPPPPARPGPAPPPGDPMPISIPEVYEHFLLGEDRPGGAPGPAASLHPQAAEAPARAPPPGAEPGTRPEPGPATVEQLDLVLRPEDKPWGPLPSLTFSQNDMCLVFVAFATWAVRTSDLHTPDAWKTVLLANIGTISAIRYFRRQVRRGRHSPSPSSSPSPSPNPSPSS